jgi:integrase
MPVRDDHVVVREVRDGVGGSGVTTHSFRKTVATLIDGGGLSARIGADHLGHTNVSVTQDRYMARGRSHIEVSDLLDRAINVDSRFSILKSGATGT